jgi:AAA+ superfamily predicted ATPase
MAELFEMYFSQSKRGKSYKSEEEYLSDKYSFLDMCIAAAALLFVEDSAEEDGQKESEKRRLHVREFPGTLEDAYESVLRKKDNVCRERLEDVRAHLVQAEKHIKERILYTPYRGNRFKLQFLTTEFKLTKLEEFFLLLGSANSYDEKYELIFANLQGREGLNHPTFQTAVFLFSLFSDVSSEEAGGLLQKKGALMECLLDIKKEVEGKPKTYSFAINKRLCSYFYGYENIDSDLQRFAWYQSQDEELQEIYIRQDLEERIAQSIQYHVMENGGKGNVLHLYGEKGNGKKLFLRQAAKQIDKGIIFVDVEKLEAATLEETERIVSKLRLECVLLDAVLCFVDSKKRENTEQEEKQQGKFSGAITYLIQLLAEKVNFFVWISQEKSTYLLDFPIHLQCIEQPMLSVGERIVLWNAYASKYPLSEDIDLNLCANQFILSVHGLQEVLRTADFIRREYAREKIEQKDIQSAVKQQSPNQLGRFATLIRAVYTWDDLVVSDEQKHQMKLICNQLRYRNVVGEEWGFFKKTAYGRGICALFYGSPGTGKTMAVQVMANELGLDLYRVDLSQLVSKYIGETEKNISTLFRKAKNINALLFFDEADSLFAKRSEVRDSHDRNANAETAHLLQKLEDYDGITILATNYVNNIDDAFKRRIKFMVNFSFPTPDVRLQLWSTILPKDVPCEEELDFEYYAEHFELSGSSIKEILTNAAFIAVSEGSKLANRHLIEAIKLNFSKYGKVLTSEDFGYLIE